MRKPVGFLVGILLAAVAWLFFKHFEITGWDALRVTPREIAEPIDGDFSALEPFEQTVQQTQQPITRKPFEDVISKARVSLTERLGASSQTEEIATDHAAQHRANTIRIASFNADFLNETKSGKLDVMDILARIVRQYDVLAIQEIASRTDDVIPRLVDQANAAGRHFDYVVGPRVGPPGSQRQFAFIYDDASLQVDRDELYTLSDRDDLLTYEPLVAWFRTRGAEENDAFTFTLANVQVADQNGIDAEVNKAHQELDVLDDVFHAIRDDGRGEDDVILVGDFHASYSQLGQLGKVTGIGWAIANVPTDTRRTKQTDNLIFHKPATQEYTGRSGVFDFMREFNMTLESALEVSNHIPIWAEFSIYEGGQAGRFANRPTTQE